MTCEKNQRIRLGDQTTDMPQLCCGEARCRREHSAGIWSFLKLHYSYRILSWLRMKDTVRENSKSISEEEVTHFVKLSKRKRFGIKLKPKEKDCMQLLH